MSMSRRRFAAGLGMGAMAGMSAALQAQGRNLRILVGFAAGGAADTVARAVGDGLREAGYLAIVENKAGASGRLASEALLAAPADGNTLLLTPVGNLTLAPHVLPGLRYQPEQFAGVGSACSMSFALAVGGGSPARSLREFLDLARGNPAMAAFGTPGAGTAMHFMGVMLGKAAKVPLAHVAYKGGSAAVTDAIGGTLPAVITTLPNLLPLHRSGKLRILAVSDARPNPALPDVPTFQSLGFGDLTVSESFAFFARAGTSRPIVASLNAAINAAVSLPRIADILQKAEYQPQTMGAEALDRKVRAEYASWARVVKASGYQPQD